MSQIPHPFRRLPLEARLRSSLLVLVASLLLMGHSFGCPAHGQEDIVITFRKNSAETIKRRGKIKEWKGFAITLANDVSETKIDNDEIVEVQTSWPPDYMAGLESLKSGELTAAIESFRAALKSERREWAQRIIRADLVRACQATDNHLAAVEQFLAISNADPQTRFFNLCPLLWLPTTAALDQPAQEWLKSSDPVQQLIGASWLLNSTSREPAIQVLEELSRDIDANIKSLAIAQLWRSRQRNVSARQLEVWKKLIARDAQTNSGGPLVCLGRGPGSCETNGRGDHQLASHSDPLSRANRIVGSGVVSGRSFTAQYRPHEPSPDGLG